MPSTSMPKQFAQRSQLTSATIDALFPEEPPAEIASGAIVEQPITELWLDDQPRQLVPEVTLQRLITEGRGQPAHLLAELKAVADQHPYYKGVLEALEALATTIAANGVLDPLLVVKRTERYILRDGHRRSLASLIAGLKTVPVRVIDEPTALQAATQQLVVNIQRQDLTALEKGRWLYKLARLVEADIRVERGVAPGPSVVEELVNHAANDAGGQEPVIHVDNEPARREISAAIRTRVLELTGLGQAQYYRLLYLNRLTPEAQEAGLTLTEGQLRPVTSLPPPEQAEIVRFIAARALTAKEANTLVEVARSGDRDAIRRVMARLAKEDQRRSRAGVSWEPLLHALPRDLWARCSSLRAELEALPAERREVRLRALVEQRRLADEFVHQIDELLTLYGEPGQVDADG